MRNLKSKFQIFILFISVSFCTSCATTVGMTAAAVTSATIAVGAAIISVPFKIVGAIGDDDEDDDEAEAEESIE